MIPRKSLIALLLLLLLQVSSCVKKRMDKLAAPIARELSLEKKIGQMIMVAVPGTKMNKKTAAIIKRYMPGGIILFGYNLKNEDKIEEYIARMQNISMSASGIPLFIATDQEGGRVKRIVKRVTQFPGNMALGIADSKELTYRMAKILGLQIKRLGINMNLAPVLDVNNNPDNPVINIRSFGSDPEIVSELGVNYIKGIQESGCISVGKHFPGHGDTNKDSHLTLPVINYNMERLARIEFPPFIKAINSGLDCVMSAHIAFPKILKSNKPATISKIFLTDILRRRMGFKGIIITDDMEMNAISKEMKMGEAAVKSILAGADIVLVTTHGKSIPMMLNSIRKAVEQGILTMERIDDSVRRIIELKLRYNIMYYTDKKIKKTGLFFTDSELSILKDADRINSEISRKAIFYHGNDELLMPPKETSRIFIMSDKILLKTVKIDGNDRVYKNLRKAFSDRKLRAGKSPKVLYYHIHELKPHIKKIKRLKDFCRKYSIEPVILSTGNPFPIVRSGFADNILISFSNTDESIRQMGNCINGDFKPVMKSKLSLGFPEKR